ncbi:uncharacterized protein [Penaeus vannamei]|uniref:uncharacterized protein isoform X2 n=1 Tax=Penaeus vannamei TaxID=6689 RepID=UPI00387F7DE5
MMASCRPRRHSVVTLRLTVTPDDELDLCRGGAPSAAPSPSPTLPPRPRSHSRQRYSQGRPPPASPLRRTPTSPLPRTPPPLSRTPTSPMSRTPTSPLCREPPSPNARSTPSPVSPRSVGGRHFRYDVWADQRGLRRRSSLLTVPSTHDPPADLHLRLPRQRSSSIAGPLRPPDLVRYLSESVQRHRLDDGGSGDVSICSSFDESEQEADATSPQFDAPEGGAHPQDPSGGGRTTPSAPSGLRSGHVSPGSFAGYPTPDPFAGDSARRRNSSADPATGVCRLRQFSITSRGGVVNRGDSLRPRRSASNTSVTSSVSSCSRERIPSIGSIASTPGCSKVPTPTSSPQYRVVMIGAAAVGKSTLITQFMTSEYMCAYDDSPGNEEAGRGMERSVSVILEGEEAELVFIRLQEITQAIAREGHADGWVVVYAINDRESFKAASTVLGRVWSLGHVTQRAVILVANKTDLQRTRVVTTSEGRTLAMTYECKFIEVSAGIDHNVDELLVGILTQIRLKNKVLSSENQEAPGSGSEGSPTATQQRMRHKNSFRVKGILNKLLNKDRKTKSCENLHVL